jgi:hypothetical protein
MSMSSPGSSTEIKAGASNLLPPVADLMHPMRIQHSR